MKTSLIYLTGFMCSGKTTIGSILANTLGRDFIDLDKEIHLTTGKSPAEIITGSGEKHFREIEAEVLRSLSTKENTVVSLGGGTIANDENLNVLKNSGVIIFLQVSPDIIYQRLQCKTDRPVFRRKEEDPPDKTTAMKRIDDLLKCRESYYLQADFIVNTDRKDIGVTIDQIVRFVESLN